MATAWKHVFETTTDWTWDEGHTDEYEVPVLEEYALLEDGSFGPIGHADLDKGTELVLKTEAEAALATERAKWAGYIVWHPGDGSEPHKLIAIGEEVIDAYREREAVLRFLAATRIDCVADGDTRYGEFVEGLERAILACEHHATLQDAHGPSSNPPDSEASADSCERNGGSASPETSG